MKIPKISTLMNSIDLFKKINNLIDVARMPLERSTAYVVGDVVHTYALPSNLYLECIQAGITSYFALNLANVSVKDELEDGTVIWRVADVKSGVGGHEIVESVPDVEDAEDNVVYFVPDETTQTPQELNVGEAITELQNKINVIETGADYVVASGHSADGLQWYRKWKSGWLEQGGYVAKNTSASLKEITITMLKSFKDTHFSIVKNWGYMDSGTSNTRYYTVYNITVNSFKISTYGGNNQTNDDTWYACGQGANE